MTQVVSKIYPYVKDITQSKKYIIQSNGTISLNGLDYTDLSFIFNITDIKQADNINLFICLSKATITMYNSFDSSKLKTYLKIDSNAYSYDYNSYNTGTLTKTLENSAIEYICNYNELTIHVEPWVINYSGLKPETTKDLCMLTTTIDPDNSYIEVISILPGISEFSITGNSIDSHITCTWEQEDVQEWTLDVIQDSITVFTVTGTEPNYTFNVGSLKRGGKTVFKLTGKYENKSVEVTKEVELEYTKATIDILEVTNTVNVDEMFTISWVSRNQTSFTLELDGRKFEGTTQQSITIPGKLVSTGTKSVTLTVTYTGPHYTNYDVSTSTFVGYGRPQKPILTIKEVYNSATPTFTWESSEQTSYILTIKRLLTIIEDSGEVIGNNKYYITQNALDNGITYTATLKIKNRFNLWSDEVSHDFTVQFNVPNSPTIHAISDTTTGSIILNINTDTSGDSEYKCSEIWKREIGGEWRRMAYKLNAIDVWQDFYTAGSIEYEYKARNIGINGGISESDIIKASTVVHGMNIYNVQNLKEFIRFTCGEQPKDKLNQTVISNLFANAKAPVHFSDGVVYWSSTFTFTLSSREDKYALRKLMQSKLLLYKDNKGRKYFGNITNSPDFQEDDVEIIDVTLEFKETTFQEYDLYCGTNMQLISWNGGWKFDETHIFGGE